MGDGVELAHVIHLSSCLALVLLRKVPFRGGHQLLYLPLKQVDPGAQAVHALNNLARRSLELRLHVLQQALHLCAD